MLDPLTLADSPAAGEEMRLASLRRYDLLDTPPEEDFDRIAALAARLFSVPLALVTLIDRERQWFKACQGPASGAVGARETGLDLSFCVHAIASRETTVVPDLSVIPRFADHPLVAGGPRLRFYAGVPLINAEGHALGTLCLLDFHPRAFGAAERQSLQDLAATVVSAMELRRAAVVLAEREAAHRQTFHNSPLAMWVFDVETLRFLDVNETALARYGYTAEEFRAMTLCDLRPPEEIPRLLAARPGTGLTPGERGLHRHQARDGRLLWVEISAHSVEYDGRPARMVIADDVTERLEAEEALRASEQRLSLHVRQTPLAVMDCNPDFVITAWNPAAERIFGYPAPEALGQNALTLLVDDPDLRRNIREAMRAMKAGARSVNVNRTKSGTMITCEWFSTPLVDDSGRVLGFASLARDVTEETRVQEALRDTQERLGIIIANAPVILFSIDRTRTYTCCDGKGLSALGRRPHESVGRSVSEIYGDYPDVLAAVERAFTGEAFARTHEIGAAVFEVQYSPVAGADGETLSVTGVALDVTEARQSENALRRSEERLRLALSAGRLGLWDCDLKTGRLAGSEGYVALLGQTPETFDGTLESFRRSLHPEDRARMARADAAPRPAGRTEIETEYRVLWPDGTTHWLASRGVFQRDEAGDPLRISGVVLDVTDRKALEEEREALLVQTEALLAEALERADRDPLTGLPNHAAFHKRLAGEADRARRDGTPLALLLMDLDNFKFFNDAYGHSTGDDLLRQVAQVLNCGLGPVGTLSRFGGDEFALLLPGATRAEAARLAGELREAVGRVGYAPPGSPTQIPLSLSVGLSCLPDDGPSRLDLLEAADARLRVARSGGDEGGALRLRQDMAHSIEGFTLLDALVTAVDNKDRYTRSHSEDVLAYALETARALGLDARTQHVVEIAALLHDVGKIGVPDSILRKPGLLTDEEFGAVRQHPMMGAVIVGAVPGFEDTLDAVRHHHERWDGRGYPWGLRGEETPLLARLLSVADAYSAMTTDRPYRKGMEPGKALRILQEGAGTQWDPACVAAFLGSRQGKAVAP